MTNDTQQLHDLGLGNEAQVIRIFRTDVGRLITIEEALFNRVKAQVANALPTLNRLVAYKAEHLYGKDEWKALPDGDRKRVGICISMMVNHGDLPLCRAERKHEYPHWYRLK